MQSTRMASININGISTPRRVGMLQDLIRRNDLDFVLLHEVAKPTILSMDIQLILTSELTCAGRPYWQDENSSLQMSLPYRRDVLSLQTTRSPSGKCVRTSELPALFYATTRSVLISGDFTCLLHPTDKTGRFTTSRALTEVVRGSAL
jgi:exonuclease III